MFTIREFPQEDDRVWRIEWLDGLELSPYASTEPCVRVVLRALKEELSHQNKSGGGRQSPSSTTVLVGVGQLPVLRVGSLWVKGRPQQSCEGLKVELKGMEVSADTVSLDGGEPKAFLRLVDLKFYNFWKKERPRLLVVGLKKPVSVEGIEYSEVLFPTFEVIRFYYGRSTRLAHAVFHGAYQDGFAKVFNEATTSRIEETGEVFIKVRTGFSRNDGWTLARIRFSKEAWQGVRAVFGSIIEDAAENRIPQPRTVFPFIGTTDMSVNAKRIHGQDGVWRLLVSSIVSCSASFPYSELTVDLDNDARPGEEQTTDGEDLVGWPIAYPPMLGPDGEFELNSVEGGNSQVQAVQLESPAEEFSALTGKIIHIPFKDRTHYSRGKWRLLNDPGIDGLSTAPGGGIESRSGLGLIEDCSSETSDDAGQQCALPGGIENLKGLLEPFNAIVGCFAVIRPLVPPLGKCLPLTAPEGRAQWAYLDSAKGWGRRILIVDLSVQGREVTLVEFQSRKGKSACMGAIQGPDGSGLSDSQLALALWSLSSHEGNWDKVALALGGKLKIDGYKHTWSSYDSGAANILERLVRDHFIS